MISPRFREGDFYGGIDAGVERIIARDRGRAAAAARGAPRRDGGCAICFDALALAHPGRRSSAESCARFRPLPRLREWSARLAGVLGVVWSGASRSACVVLALFCFLFILRRAVGRHGGRGGWASGGWGGGGSEAAVGGGGGFSGGGGGFGGGGASGSW